MAEPRRMGRYRLLGRLGRGGMGEVHLARAYGAEGVAKDLCVKLIRAERLDYEGAGRRFVTEARLSMGLHHSNIVAVFDFGRCDDGYYLAMEWVDGADLSALVATKPLPPAIGAHVGAEVARALAYAHGRQEPVVHCDVKPANVLVSRAGDVKLADFGTATVTGGGGRSGTPGYMAPEQRAEHGVEPRTDAYALGVVLTRVLTGERNAEAIEDDELRDIALQLTRHEPSARPSAAEAANRLEGYVARARAGGAPSPREVLAVLVAEAATGARTDGERELEPTASFARDGDAVLESLSAATTVEPLEASARAEPSPVEPTGDPVPRHARRWPAWVMAGAALAVATLGGWLTASRSASFERPPPTAAAETGARAMHTRPAATAPGSDDGARRSTHSTEPAPGDELSIGLRRATPQPTSPPTLAAAAPRVAAALTGAFGSRRRSAPPSSRPTHPPRASPASRRVSTSEPARERAMPAAHLSVNAVPWAEVTLDGRPLGTTPLFEIPLASGEHRLVFRNPVLGATESRSVHLAAGQRRRLVVDLREPSEPTDSATDPPRP